MNVPDNAGALNKVLLVGCCRTHVLTKALERIRRLDSNLEISALIRSQFVQELTSNGFRELLVFRGRWYGLSRIRVALLRLIRRRRFSCVAIPYMESDDASYANVHRMALLFGSPRYLIIKPDGELRMYSSWEFRGLTIRTSLAKIKKLCDVPLLLITLVLALATKPAASKARVRNKSGKKRILHVVNSLALGGAQTQLMELLSRTPQTAYEVEVLLLEGGDDISRTRLRRPGLPIAQVASWPRLFASLLEIRRICLRGRYDVVHTWLFHANIVGVAGARLAGCPRIISSIRSSNIGSYPWMCRPWFRIGEIMASRISDVVTVNASRLAPDHSQWARLPQNRIEVVHNGIALDAGDRFPERDGAFLRERFGVPANDPVVGTSGRLAREKDYPTFVRIVEQLRHGFPNIHGVIVGEGPLRQELTELARKLGLENRVHFAGQQHLPLHFVAGMDVYVMTSIIEGFPNALLEAAFLKTPCVATDVGATPDILGEEGLLFQPGDVATATIHIRSILENPEASAKTAQRIQARVQRLFSAEQMVSRWLSLYGD